jgi:hypothetical protein
MKHIWVNFNQQKEKEVSLFEGLITLYLGIISKTKLGQAVGGFVYTVGAIITFLDPLKQKALIQY